MAYREHPNREVFERQWLERALRGNIHQGIYVASASGQPLGQANRGWPDPNPSEVLAALREAVARHEALGAERRLARTLDPVRDKLRWEHEAFRKPEGTLDLRITSRGYPYDGMTSFDHRHPMYYHLDRIWFKPSEWRAWLPSSLTVGSTARVTGPAFTRFVLLSHMQAGQSAWWEEHLRSGSMTSEVVSVRGDAVDLKISANYRMKADSQWCEDTYDGNLLARATFDRAAQRFTRFDLAMLGSHTVGRMQPNIHVGSPTQKVAVAAMLNPLANDSDRMLPSQWKYGYSLNWARTP